MMDDAERRERMIVEQIEARGVRDPLVLDAVRAVPREIFVPPALRAEAYLDQPLPIEAGQTISQPFIVAYMIEALQLAGGERALEIGAGSGYAAAVLAQIAGAVFAIERIPELADSAKRHLATAGIANVTVACDDGSEGWPEEAPFDAILVSAGAPTVPEALRAQLAIGGRLVIPVGDPFKGQWLRRITRRTEDRFDEETLTAVAFVPLIGKAGWPGGTRG